MTLPHPFTLRQLQYVDVLAETLSFRRAAERCHVSQPALSAQIAEVESQLGVTLFERSRKHVLLTPAARALLPAVRRAITAADDLRWAAEHERDPDAAAYRIGVIPTISPYLLPRIAPAIAAARPKLRLMWLEDKTETLVQALEDGRIEAALLALEAPLGEVEHAELGRDPFVLAVPRAHPLAKGKGRVPLDALQGESILLLDDGHCFRDQALSFCAQAGPEELGFRATSLTTLAQMVASGAGVTLLPELAVATENQAGTLVMRRFEAPEPHRTLALVWRRHSPLREPLTALAQLMKKAQRAR